MLYCHCARAGLIPEELRRAALALVLERGGAFTALPDLCASAAARSPLLRDSGDRAIGCYPRALRWLLERAGASRPGTFAGFGLRGRETSSAIQELRGWLEAGGSGDPDAGCGEGVRELTFAKLAFAGSKYSSSEIGGQIRHPGELYSPGWSGGAGVGSLASGRQRAIRPLAAERRVWARAACGSRGEAGGAPPAPAGDAATLEGVHACTPSKVQRAPIEFGYLSTARCTKWGPPELASLLSRILERGFAAVVGALSPGGSSEILVAFEDPRAARGDPARLDASELSEEAIVQRLEAEAGPSSLGEPTWVPWYPVIDYERCTSCGLCLDFCLFGVYSRGNGGRVEVRNPENCKTNCPACARVCPKLAIMFPRYKEGPLSGADVEEGETARVDLQKLAAGDVYAALKARSGGKRFSLELPVADAEGCSCDLLKALDIPPDAMASLSDQDIERLRRRRSEEGGGRGG